MGFAGCHLQSTDSLATEQYTTWLKNLKRSVKSAMSLKAKVGPSTMPYLSSVQVSARFFESLLYCPSGSAQICLMWVQRVAGLLVLRQATALHQSLLSSAAGSAKRCQPLPLQACTWCMLDTLLHMAMVRIITSGCL